MKKKKSSKKNSVTRKKSKSAAPVKARKVSAKPRSLKSNAKARPAKMQKKTGATKSKAARKATRKATGRTSAPRDTARVFRSSLPTRGEGVEAVDLDSKGMGSNSGGQSGDLQGLSNVESADSESVGELLEEGNAYEAEIVKGVQDVPDADVSEVHTHQGREEDDLPEDFREN
ncbi:MAG TPA: hypothetical protein VGH83_05725 [Candidatus Acidoferrum sp.]